MKPVYGLALFDYVGPDPCLPNVHTFGFMRVEDRYFLDRSGQFIRPWQIAQEVAKRH